MTEALIPSILHGVVRIRRVRISQKIRALSPGTSFQTLELETFRNRHGTSIVASVVNLVRPTIDRHQFITLSVHFCVQRDGRDASRLADLSAAAETSSVNDSDGSDIF